MLSRTNLARVARRARLSGGSRAFSTNFTSLPVIDISALVSRSTGTQDKLETARQLHEACRDVGFFYIVGHGMDPGIQLGVLEQARQWFALPEAVKREISLSPSSNYRGYQSLGDNVTRYDGGFVRDWHEAIDLYREVAPEEIRAGGLQPSPIHGVNLWPHHTPQLTPLLHQYLAGCLHVGAAVMRGIALGLHLSEDFFEGDKAGDSYWIARVMHYPPLETGSVHSAAGTGAAAGGAEVELSTQLSCGEHTDYGLLTLVNQEEHTTALQVKNAVGQWINADPISGSFVCNIGDMLQVWTNGLYKPTLHRVVNTNSSRISIPFFYEPCYEAVVEPLPQFCNSERPSKLSPVRYGSWLEGKILNNFELEQA